MSDAQGKAGLSGRRRGHGKEICCLMIQNGCESMPLPVA